MVDSIGLATILVGIVEQYLPQIQSKAEPFARVQIVPFRVFTVYVRAPIFLAFRLYIRATSISVASVFNFNVAPTQDSSCGFSIFMVVARSSRFRRRCFSGLVYHFRPAPDNCL